MDRQDRLQPERESPTSSPGCPPENRAENTLGPRRSDNPWRSGDEKRHPASSSMAARGTLALPTGLEPGLLRPDTLYERLMTESKVECACQQCICPTRWNQPTPRSRETAGVFGAATLSTPRG